jgi:hypothetical protein
MGLISRLLGRSKPKPSQPSPQAKELVGGKTVQEEGVEAGSAASQAQPEIREKETVRREDIDLGEGPEAVQTQPDEVQTGVEVDIETAAATSGEAPGQPANERGRTGRAEVADAALREALGAIQGVVDKARAYLTEIGSMQASARRREETGPKESGQVTVGQQSGLVTEASAAVLTEYMKHFFELVSMQNRLLERRLDSLEELIARLDKHVTEDAAEVSARLTTLEGVQLPLVKAVESPASQAAKHRDEPVETAVDSEPAAERVGPTQSGDLVQGVLRLKGLPSFRSLFTIRDELRSQAEVISAEAASFEAGQGELRVKASRPIGGDEICAALREATGLVFAATGPMSFEATQAESGRA